MDALFELGAKLPQVFQLQIVFLLDKPALMLPYALIPIANLRL